jgi:hypothetical protein
MYLPCDGAPAGQARCGDANTLARTKRLELLLLTVLALPKASSTAACARFGLCRALLGGGR